MQGHAGAILGATKGHCQTRPALVSIFATGIHTDEE
jgi:hypothetical protein